MRAELEALIFHGMSEERPQIDLDRGQYQEALTGPLASPKYLRWSLVIFLGAAIVVACIAVWLPQAWWLTFGVIPISMWAGAALAGLVPSMFFGTDRSGKN